MMFCDYYKIPLEVGDLVYKIVHNKVVRYEITSIIYSLGKVSFRASCVEEFDGVSIQSIIEFDLSELDKEVFDSYEKASKK
jgi:hypothetical protein